MEPETGNTAISLGTHASLHPNHDITEKNTLQLIPDRTTAVELYAHQALATYYRDKQESKTQSEQVGEDGLAASQANSHGKKKARSL